jgi:hypothetical protein
VRRASYLLTGTVLAGALLLSPTAAVAAASSTHPRITTLVASSQYIVYKQKVTSANMSSELLTGGTIYATDITGERHSLPGFSNDKHALYLTGSILVQAQTSIHTSSDRQSVRWRDLNNGTTATVTDRPGEIVVAAGPHGWITEASTTTDGRYGTVQRLAYVRTNGVRTNLGSPFPLGQSIRFAVSDTGVVVTPGVSDENHFASQVRYLPWAHLSHWRTIHVTGRDIGVDCAPSSRTHIACSATSVASGATRFGLIALDGSGARWVQTKHPSACKAIRFATRGDNLYAIETSDAGVCTKGKLYRFDFDGTLVNGSSHHYSSTSIKVGLGSRVIVSSLDQRHIDTLTGVTRSPTILVRV